MQIYIYNKENEKMAVNVSESAYKEAPVVIIEHGLAGFKEEGMIVAAAEAFKNRHFTVVTFDARFSLGDSDGALEQANFTHFIEDLKTLISWVKTKDFYTGKLILCGHSLGAGACLHYAAHHADDIYGVVSIAGVFSGKLLLESYLEHKPQFVHEWQKNKVLYRKHPYMNERHGYISYAHIKDALRYHLIEQAPEIKCPVLLIAADHDISSTLQINRLFFDALHTFKELVVIEGASHTFKTPQNRQDLIKAIDKWIKKREIF